MRNFFRRPGSILLLFIILILIICPIRIHMYYQKILEIQSGQLSVDSEFMAADLHPYSAYIMAIPYIIIEVTLCALYYVRTRD